MTIQEELDAYKTALDRACQILFDDATVMEINGEYRYAKSPEFWKEWLLTGKIPD